VNPEQLRTELEKPEAQRLLNEARLLHLAYTGSDGHPRAGPVGFTWDGSRLYFCTAVKAPKVRALRQRPQVAVSIGDEVEPPCLLLVRGGAEVEEVEGVPAEFLEASRKTMPPERFAAWEMQQRAVYERMARVAIVPQWAKLIDFQETLPQAVDEILRSKGWSPQD